MDDLHAAIQLAAAAARPFPTVAPHVERAAALARFEASDPPSGPYWRATLSSGVPQRPVGPMFPAFAAVDPTSVVDALETLQRELVWAADCAEFTDANLNAAQYLRAAGHVDLAHRAVLALAGPGLGLVLGAPTRVRELAATLGQSVEDLLAGGSMGFLPAIGAHYRWDLHHEEPVTTAEALGPRELLSYSARFASGRSRVEAALAGAPRAGWFHLDDGATDAFTLEWHAETPDWALPPADPDVLGDWVRRAREGEEVEPLELRPSLPALDVAAALGAPDAFARTVDVHMSSWRIELPLGTRTVDATLDGRAHGAPVPGLTLPAARSAVLTPEDRVRALRIR